MSRWDGGGGESGWLGESGNGKQGPKEERKEGGGGGLGEERYKYKVSTSAHGRALIGILEMRASDMSEKKPRGVACGPRSGGSRDEGGRVTSTDGIAYCGIGG